MSGVVTAGADASRAGQGDVPEASRGPGGTKAPAPGRLIAVVGPSGVGKDSVMAGLAAADPRFRLVRRVITREAGLGGEDFEPVSEATFAARQAAGAFCLSWHAHGLSYGIPAATRAEVAAGETRLANLSRLVLPEAATCFPGLEVLHITARPETLARRLAGRGRESLEEIAARQARAALPLPKGLPVTEIANDGPLTQTVARALSALTRARVTP
ncbi:phosphonate metabolism protein/1,5-bisphosphokinase (PRPP-forming) PhnN [Roseivivax sp. GX 12232]|uniref:phosphonate metabolism protein/1,5-bisphosphokinase (PRPP-forming) PhnN n=1 Tax=Roseivivax sp. GX 12232 TaxID=2900547 RepID=UPI001E35AE17|nr:phosphonate metabolism protein/1,5-bisphosphokinase (PRPP-forming) PhnN [Roseivivax sp. GX 12232]MCE0506438.1 phosphonate metabolism protein/1,5-bisphosphokinase (PRPP-forming) PhnN [Roseivivax sp. GX 12232]